MIHLPVYPKHRRRLGTSFRKMLPLTLFGLLVAATIALWQLQISAYVQVKQVQIEGNNRVSNAAVRHLADIYYDSYIWTVNETPIANRIAQHPWIRNATVQVSYPNEVTIHVEEHKPVLLLAADRFWYVNDAAEIFRIADPNNINFPVLTGITSADLHENAHLGQRIIQEALFLYDTVNIPLIGGAEALSEIHFNRVEGFSVYLRNGSQLIFGFYPPETRIQRLRTMIAKGLDLSIPQRIELDAERIALVTPLSSFIQEN